MALFKLLHDGQTVMIHDTEVMEPGELKALKHLATFGKFSLERVNETGRIPPLDHDALDDIALEMVGTSKGASYAGTDLLSQARRRVQERNLG